MADKIKLAAIQLCSGIAPQANLLQLEKLVADAANAGAQYVFTPEMSIGFIGNKKDMAQYIKPFENNQDIKACADIAKKHDVFLHIGSMAILADCGDSKAKAKYYNRSLLFSPLGELIDYYDKIHLFDASPPNDRPYKESDDYLAGERVVVAELGDFKLGFSICYDLRFAALYHKLCEKGAQILAIPAAFTLATGKAHWEVLLRARAIETGCYVVAAAQGAEHENGRFTFGHSMIIDPWGEIVAIRDDNKSGFIIADIDIDEVERVRKIIPNLKNNSFFV